MVRATVVDADGVALPAGQEGRVQVRGPFLFAGYLHRPELTAAPYDGDSFDTGDVAQIVADGYLNITGRTKDVIIRGGENIPVAYVENVLYEHPDVAAVALVGLPDPRLQERACAVVVLKPALDPGAAQDPGRGFTMDDMRAFLADKGVARQYWPERLELFPELPRTASGKIRKVELRDMLR